MMLVYIKSSVLLMLNIQFCALKTGSESKGGEKEVHSLCPETALTPLHSLSRTVFSVAWTSRESSPLLLVSFLN